MTLDEQPLEVTPMFYDNPSGGERKQILGGGSVGGTMLPISGIIKEDIDPSTGVANIGLGYTFQIRHNQKVAKECFARYRGKGQEAWQIFPTNLEMDGTIGGTRSVTINFIDKDVVEVNFQDFNIYDLYEFEFYFFDFYL